MSIINRLSTISGYVRDVRRGQTNLGCVFASRRRDERESLLGSGATRQNRTSFSHVKNGLGLPGQI